MICNKAPASQEVYAGNRHLNRKLEEMAFWLEDRFVRAFFPKTFWCSEDNLTIRKAKIA